MLWALKSHKLLDLPMTAAGLGIQENLHSILSVPMDPTTWWLGPGAMPAVEVFPGISYSNLNIHSNSLSYSFMLTFILRALESVSQCSL